MKHIIILGDGMADWSVKSLGDKTLLQYAKTPYMDKLARMGRNGRLITVAEAGAGSVPLSSAHAAAIRAADMHRL